MYVCVSIYACIYMHTCAGAPRGQKRTLGPLELDLSAIMNSQMWMLGTEFVFYPRTARVLTDEAFFPSPILISYCLKTLIV